MIASYKSSILSQESSPHLSSILVGSYGKNTEIRPPSDIDILFILPSSLFDTYDRVSYNGQSCLLQDVKKVLQRKYPNTDCVGDGQVVIVPFSTFKVEVLSVFSQYSDVYKYPDANKGGSWKITNPKAEKTNLIESNRITTGNTIKLIKMLKRWKSFCNVPLKSLLIELSVVEFLRFHTYKDKGYTYYDWIIRDFFTHLRSKANTYIIIPGISETIPYGDKWISKCDDAITLSKQACDYETNKNDLMAAYTWRKIFGDDYPF